MIGTIYGYLQLVEINVSFISIIIISYTLYCFIVQNIHPDEIIRSQIKHYGLRMYGFYGVLGILPIATRSFRGVYPNPNVNTWISTTYGPDWRI